MTALTAGGAVLLLLCILGAIACRWAARRIDLDFPEAEIGGIGGGGFRDQPTNPGAQPMIGAEERWLPIPEFAGKYEASNLGNVRRVSGKHRCTGENKKQTKVPKGYLLVSLYSEGRQVSRLVHALVCPAFHGPKPSPLHQVAHADGDGENNCESNLRWATAAENARDRERHGRTARGERQGAAVLSAEQVVQIREMISLGVPQKELARHFNVSKSAICLANLGINWAHIGKPTSRHEAA
jgi:hypothetical protein